MNKYVHAFPDSNGYGGMRLRDYFAAKIMAALLTGSGVVPPPEALAARAYMYADALLLEREL